MRKLLMAFPFALIMSSVYAQDVTSTQEISAPTQNTMVNNTVIGNPQDWDLSQEEWTKYQKLMQGPFGHWYPKLTPSEILGLNAQTPQEQQHYAEIVAREEHDKLARELDFDRAVHQALLKLYPNEPIIKSFNLSPFNPIQSAKQKNSVTLQNGDHLILFVDTSKGLDFVALPRLIADIKNIQGVILDVFCIGNIDDNAIRTWAKLNEIPMNLVAAGRITLNHDNGKLQKTAGNVELPYVMLVRNGESKPVSVWSLT